jgi:hypothetical protein
MSRKSAIPLSWYFYFSPCPIGFAANLGRSVRIRVASAARSGYGHPFRSCIGCFHGRTAWCQRKATPGREAEHQDPSADKANRSPPLPPAENPAQNHRHLPQGCPEVEGKAWLDHARGPIGSAPIRKGFNVQSPKHAPARYCPMVRLDPFAPRGGKSVIPGHD